MLDNLVSAVYLVGTSTHGTEDEMLWNLKIEVPFLDFFTIAIIFLIAFLVFKLTFVSIWKD